MRWKCLPLAWRWHLAESGYFKIAAVKVAIDGKTLQRQCKARPHIAVQFQISHIQQSLWYLYLLSTFSLLKIQCYSIPFAISQVMKPMINTFYKTWTEVKHGILTPKKQKGNECFLWETILPNFLHRCNELFSWSQPPWVLLSIRKVAEPAT